jgi:hypothetical protein
LGSEKGNSLDHISGGVAPRCPVTWTRLRAGSDGGPTPPSTTRASPNPLPHHTIRVARRHRLPSFSRRPLLATAGSPPPPHFPDLRDSPRPHAPATPLPPPLRLPRRRLQTRHAIFAEDGRAAAAVGGRRDEGGSGGWMLCSASPLSARPLVARKETRASRGHLDLVKSSAGWEGLH